MKQLITILMVLLTSISYSCPTIWYGADSEGDPVTGTVTILWTDFSSNPQSITFTGNQLEDGGVVDISGTDIEVTYSGGIVGDEISAEFEDLGIFFVGWMFTGTNGNNFYTTDRIETNCLICSDIEDVSCFDGDSCTENDNFDDSCNCIGTPMDVDMDNYGCDVDCDDNDSGVTQVGQPCGINGITQIDCTCLETPLPIEIKSFTARVENNSVTIELITASEYNSKEIEFQVNKQGWKPINILQAQGVSEVEQSYHAYYILKEGINYFRVKLIDLDGFFKYSKIITVDSKIKNKTITLDRMFNGVTIGVNSKN